MAEFHRHPKRQNGITKNMKMMIQKATKEHYENEIIYNLLAQLNPKSNPRKAEPARKSPRKFTSPQKVVYTSSSSSEDSSNNDKKNIQKFPRIVKMVSNMSSAIHEDPQRTRNDKFESTCKPSPDNSTESQEAQLKQENERFKALCLAEQLKLANLEKEIQLQNRTQKMRLELYRNKIEKLKKIVALEIFPSEGSDSDEDQDCGEIDNLSINSK